MKYIALSFLLLTPPSSPDVKVDSITIRLSNGTVLEYKQISPKNDSVWKVNGPIDSDTVYLMNQIDNMRVSFNILKSIDNRKSRTKSE